MGCPAVAQPPRQCPNQHPQQDADTNCCCKHKKPPYQSVWGYYTMNCGFCRYWGCRCPLPAGRTAARLPAPLCGTARGKPGFLFEHTTEIQRVIIPDDLGNFTDAVFGAFQQALCIDDTQRLDIPCGRQAHILFEATDEPCRAHAQGLGVFIHIDAGSIILVKIGGCGRSAPAWCR